MTSEIKLPETVRDKILTWEEAHRRHGPDRDHRLIFTNGCFDILHRGHVEVLIAARALGDRLLVGLNSDASVRRLKGSGRPLQPEVDRAICLAALECVDAVVIFEQDTPKDLIALLRPDAMVKGGDYTPQQLPEREVVEAAGGQVIILPYIGGRSTTELIARAARAAGELD
ncbi:MAG: D-glycero-beta-D-manno-heptose 1-phosphate adenylyltransferase [Gemmatimonadota bacterium]|nr:MAG: D-glycero-beta-D-manno-heptose 1-phosphate adenylyltransferase [Gemmatimonadota bacterium]